MNEPKKSTPKPWLSGWCNPIHPLPHRRCSGGYDEAHPCICHCHKTSKSEAMSTITSTPTGVIVTAAEPGTDEWFAARREGITGTDLPKILGLTKYGNALSVWMDKRGELEDEAGEAAAWGNILEGPVADEWARRHGAAIKPIGVLAHHELTWMRASLDRKVLTCPDGELGECGLEIKTRSAFKASEWKEGIPDDTLAQIAWGCIVSGYDHTHVAALIGGQKLVSLRYDRDETLEAYLVDAAKPVWDAVREGFPPEAHPDAEGVLLGLLDRLYAAREGARDLDPTTAERWLTQYDEGAEMERRGDALKTEAKTALVQMIEDGDAGLISDQVAFTYRRPTPGKTLAKDRLDRLRIEKPSLYGWLIHHEFITDTRPGPRFLVKKRSTTEEDTEA